MSPTEEPDNHSSHAMQLLEAEQFEQLSDYLGELHPVELASAISQAPDEDQDELIQRVTGLDSVADLLGYGSDSVRSRAIELLDDARIAAAVRRLEMDDAADILRLLSRRRQVSVLRRVSPALARQLKVLLAYDEETAGGIMTPLFVAYRSEQTANEALRSLRERLHDAKIDPDTDITYAYVVNENNVLQGVCSLREILTATPETKLAELIISDVICAHPDDDQELVARLIADYDFSSIPVVSEHDRTLLGIVTVDDVLDVIEEEYTEDLLLLAGSPDEDIIEASTLGAIRSRLPWLLASWCGGLAGAMLLGNFSTTLERIVALAFFMPVVFGMAGNVGSQSSTITVRGIATGELSEQRSFGRVRSEVLTGLLLGVIFGVFLSGAAFALYQQIELSIIVGSSIMITMTCAALFGSVLPLFFRRFGIDPAVASGPLVTTTTDILSITIYFSIATLLLQYR